MATSSSNESSSTSYFDHFVCSICLEVLREPVQCARNEHYFCKSCITRHLTRSQTCPVCQDRLTTATLRPSPRVMANLLQQFQSPRCRYANRGCTASVRHEVLLSHHEECGFAPVQCSNDGCEETLNRKDLASHEREKCNFPTVTCEECKGRMSQREYGRHPCYLLKEVDKNKVSIVDVQKILREIQKELRRQGDEVQRLAMEVAKQSSTAGKEDKAKETSAVENTTEPQDGEINLEKRGDIQATATENQQGDDTKKTRQFMATQVQNPSNEVQARIDRRIVVAGGGSRSYEVFNWSTQKWTLHENALFFNHNDAFSFVYDDKIMICGGTDTNRIECLDMYNPISSVSAFPALLPSTDCGRGALRRDKILTFGKSVLATSLKAPYETCDETEVHISYRQIGKKLSGYGAACVNDNRVVIVGGRYTKDFVPVWTNDVQLYNPTTKQLRKLASLPYRLADMAVQAYKDNVIILGGETERARDSNDVLMYNITSQQCSKLPSMLEKRSKCAAAVMGDKIFAFGGTSSHTKEALKTAEYLVLGEDKWKKLPSMHIERAGATACVVPGNSCKMPATYASMCEIS